MKIQEKERLVRVRYVYQPKWDS